MGASWTELIRWQELAGCIADLAEGADAVPEADLAIRRRLLETYVANRAVLGRGPGGVEVFVKPVVEARLLRGESAEAAALAWLSAEADSPESEWRRAAAELLGAARGGRAPPGKRTGTAAHHAWR